MSVQNIFQNSLLSAASYADFLGAVNPDDSFDKEKVKAALIYDPPIGDPLFSASQAQSFTDQWKVVSHQPNTASGFSGTLFQNKENNRYSLAIRGTEGLFSMDLVSDLFGLALQVSATAGAIIFLPTQKNEPKKGYPNTAKTPQNQLFFGHAHNSLCSNNALTDPKNNRLCGRSIRGVKPTPITEQAQAKHWEKAA